MEHPFNFKGINRGIFRLHQMSWNDYFSQPPSRHSTLIQRWNLVDLGRRRRTTKIQRWNNVEGFDVEEMTWFQRWNNVEDFNVEEMTLFQRWYNVENFDVEKTTSFQRWNNVAFPTNLQRRKHDLISTLKQRCISDQSSTSKTWPYFNVETTLYLRPIFDQNFFWPFFIVYHITWIYKIYLIKV